MVLALSTVHAQPTSIKLPAPVQGKAAIQALGAQLPAVAVAHGLDAQKLTTLFGNQPSLGVDRDGRLFFACEAPSLTQLQRAALASGLANAVAAAPVEAGATSVATTDPFRLHSFPGAALVIFLDFDGNTTSGTAWNANFTGGAPIVSQPFDLDGSPATFNAAERDVIRHVWQRVAEDYAPFVVDVTTEDPGIEALRKTSSGDAFYGIHVVISPTNWYSAAAGGVGYIGSFNAGTDTPSFVFTAQLANSEKPIAESAAHEVGHTVGLYHDGLGGSAPSEYYLGQGNWAPIMGGSYYKAITQFSRGEYANANNQQDDLANISAYLPYATDDHGDTLGSATLWVGTNIADGGTIESNSDVDVFRFSCGPGVVSLVVNNPAPEPNLDVKAELLDGNGQVLQSSNPASLDAAINASVPAGTYYLRISGVGAGDPLTDGYSNYGSVGNYVITGTVPSTNPTAQPPLAVAGATVISGPAPLAVTFLSTGSTDADGYIVSYNWSFGTGASSTAANPVYTYNSAGSFTAILTVRDNQGLTGSASVVINVGTSGNGLPTITAQPLSQIVSSGGTAIFSVAVTGTPTVQWYRNGQTWSGWTGTTLTLAGVSANDTGTYTAVVTNSAGSVTSAPATLSLAGSAPANIAPVVTTQPVSQTVAAGANISFTASASGTPAPTYQWMKGGVAISGATNPTFVLNAVTTASAGNYTLVASNVAGSATSNVAVLTVSSTGGNIAPTITAQPASQVVTPGGTATFTIAASGTPTPSVQWYRDGLTWSGWTGTSLTLSGVSANDTGVYSAVVTNSVGAVTSAPATLSLTTNPVGNVAPVITTQPVSQTATTGANVTFTVVASGTPTPSVQWYRNGQTWSGWTGTELTLGFVTSNDIGSYTAAVTNSAGTVTSQVALLNVR